VRGRRGGGMVPGIYNSLIHLVTYSFWRSLVESQFYGRKLKDWRGFEAKKEVTVRHRNPCESAGLLCIR
jgi:hypothetical protein